MNRYFLNVPQITRPADQNSISPLKFNIERTSCLLKFHFLSEACIDMYY